MAHSVHVYSRMQGGMVVARDVTEGRYLQYIIFFIICGLTSKSVLIAYSNNK